MKHQKPIKTDASFLYICPNKECSSHHWLFLRETQTKNYKVVCVCGTIFKPKTIKSIEIVYDDIEINKPSDPIQTNNNSHNHTKNTNEQEEEVPSILMEQCCSILSQYGFTKTEAEYMVYKTYSETKITDPVDLIKMAFKNDIGPIVRPSFAFKIN